MRNVVGLLVVLVATATADARPRFRAVALPPQGRGYEIPSTWRERGLRWGTPELVGLLRRAAARVRAWDRTATVYIGDLSLRSGGATAWHRSHRRGIDADLLYFAREEDGAQRPPPRAMQSFDEDDDAFDDERNWLLCRALLTDPAVAVTAIFVADWIRDRLLDRARELGEPRWLVARAEAILGQPSDSAVHDDHMHVRIAAPAPSLTAREAPVKHKAEPRKNRRR